MRKIYEPLSKEKQQLFAKINLLVLDFDGTLTDNTVYTNQNGTESVQTDRGDGLGLEYLRNSGSIKSENIIILSRETNLVTAARAKKLKIECIHGLKNKINKFREEVQKRNIPYEQVCFVGNDLNDIECIKEAGLGIAVADAYEQTKKYANYITKRPGGKGAVREVCELIMYAKGKHPNP